MFSKLMNAALVFCFSIGGMSAQVNELGDRCVPNVTVNSAAICLGDSATLNAAGSTSYVWYPSAGLSTTTGSSVKASPSATTTYSVIGTDGCGTFTAVTTVTVNPLPVASISSSGIGCEDTDILFTGSNGTAPYTFSYKLDGTTQKSVKTEANASAVTYSRSNVALGTYTYSLTSVKDANNCTTSVTNETTVVSVYSKPSAAFVASPEQTNLLEPKVTVQNQSIGASSWVWDFGDSTYSYDEFPLEHSYPDTGAYKISLVITTDNGCKDSSYYTVYVKSPFVLYVPSAFTPNDDGINDVFSPQGEIFLNYALNVYDRWGNQVFFSNDMSKGWDGTNGGSVTAQKDTYIYVIDVKPLSNKHDYTYTGYINLLR